LGVDLFFVLSGYLISRHLIRHGLGTGRFSFWRYVAMRALRIVPAYLAVLGLILASAFPLYGIDWDHLGPRVLYHILFLQDYLPSTINIVFWSLGVEEKFYLLAPLLLWLALTKKRPSESLLLLLGIAAACVALRAVRYSLLAEPVSYELFFRTLRSPFHACLDPLMIGVAVALAEHRGVPRLSPARAAGLLSGTLLVLTAWLCSHDFMGRIGYFDATAQPVLIAGSCGLLTLAAARMGHLALPGQRAVRLVSRLSYSLYLVHYPLLPLSIAIAEASARSTAAFWLAYATLSFAIAALLHYGVERPFLMLKDRLEAQARADTQAPFLPLDSTTASMNFTPTTPSCTVGTSRAPASGSRPSSRARISSAASV
jgi:peptidoglycan/LPS O-acetylase OafA/YrhL